MIGCRLENLSLTYGSRQILRHLQLEIRPGEFVAMVGASGSGKSSLLRLVAELQTPSEGHIDFSQKPRRAFVFQDANLLPWRSVEENVSLPSEIHKTERPDEVADALKAVHLWDQRKLFPHELSGGMKMRVSLARALSADPQMLLLDEPFSSLDEITRFDLQEQLRDLWLQKKWTTLFVTHSLSEAVFLADRILILKDGRFQSDRTNPLPEKRGPSLRRSEDFNRLVSELGEDFRK